MDQEERENFYRFSTIIVDHGTYALSTLLQDDLSRNSQTLIDFINKHQHGIYHLHNNRQLCCQCLNNRLPVTTPPRRVLALMQLELLLDKSGQKLPGHQQGNRSTCCCGPANQNVTISDLDITLLRCLLINFSTVCQNTSLKQAIEELVKCRNSFYGHVTAGKIPDSDYTKYKTEVERLLMTIARACKIENEMRQRLQDAETRPLDMTICLQYQSVLLDEIRRRDEMEKQFEKLQEQIRCNDEIVGSRLESIETLISDIGQRKRCLIDQTIACITEQLEDDTFVYLNAYDKCHNILDKFNIVTLKSRSGGGKTKLSLKIAASYRTSKQYVPILFVNDEIVRNMDLIDFKNKYIYIIEDFFGRGNPQFIEDLHRGVLDIMHDCSRNTTCQSKFVITISTGNIIDEAILKHHTIFSLDRVVNLDEFCAAEKRWILRTHLQKHKVLTCSHSDIFLCRKGIKETRDLSFKICKATIEIICFCNMDCHTGFPQACHMFCSDRNFLNQGERYFRNTSTALVEEINTIRLDGFDKCLSRYRYCVLVYCAFKGSIDTEDIDSNLFESVAEYYDSKSYKQGLVKQAVTSLHGKYLFQKRKTTFSSVNELKTELSSSYVLQHDTIKEAILISYAEDCDILPKCSEDFVFRYIRPKGYTNPNEMYMLVLFVDQSQLIKKLLSMIQNNYDSVYVGMYLKKISLEHRNDTIIKQFFTEAFTSVSKSKFEGLFNGLTDYGENSDVVKLHPEICRRFIIYGSADVICKFCRPTKWSGTNGLFVRIKSFILTVRLFSVLLGLQFHIYPTGHEKEKFNYCNNQIEDHYVLPQRLRLCDTHRVNRVCEEKQRKVGEYVFHVLISKGYKCVKNLFFFMVLNPYFINPVMFMAFLDGLTNFGKRSHFIGKYKAFFSTVLFKYGSLPVVLAICRPISFYSEDYNIIRVCDEQLAIKLCTIISYVTPPPLDITSKSPTVGFLSSYKTFFMFPFNTIFKQSLEDVRKLNNYFYEYGIKPNNKTFLKAIYNGIIEHDEEEDVEEISFSDSDSDQSVETEGVAFDTKDETVDNNDDLSMESEEDEQNYVRIKERFGYFSQQQTKLADFLEQAVIHDWGLYSLSRSTAGNKTKKLRDLFYGLLRRVHPDYMSSDSGSDFYDSN